MRNTSVVAVIPARLASSRFPRKPLIEVQGLPMIEHVRRRALLCRRFSDVIVATCDPEIADVVIGNGGKVLMTLDSHPGATDRVAEAATQIDCTHVVNVQGDEILVLPADLETMVCAIENEPAIPVWNAVAGLDEADSLSDRSVVKCAVSVSGRILFCARDFSRLSLKKESHFEPIRRVLGIMGYRKDFLEHYSRLSRTPLELMESIDQSRILEQDVLLRGVPFTRGYTGINEQHEVKIVQECLCQDPLQQAVFQELLAS